MLANTLQLIINSLKRKKKLLQYQCKKKKINKNNESKTSCTLTRHYDKTKREQF